MTDAFHNALALLVTEWFKAARRAMRIAQDAAPARLERERAQSVYADGRGEPIYLDVPLDRGTLEDLVDEKVTQSIALCRKVLEDNGLDHESVARIVLVGGPTKMPIIKRMVQAELGIEVEDPSRVDPMTAVAIGAAIYCESRDWSDTGSTAKATRRAVENGGVITVACDYEARTASTHARLTVRPTNRASGATVQVDSPDGTTSGRRPLTEQVVLDLNLPNIGANRFRAFVFDGAGRPVREASQDIVIERLLAATTGVPATQTIAVKLLDDQERNTLDVIVAKGTPLPQDGVTSCRAARTVRAGENAEIRIELFQLSDDRVRDPELNLAIGIFRIDASDFPEGMSIRKGDPVLVHWTMSEGQTLTAEVELPTIRQRFDAHDYYDYQASLGSFEGEDGDALATTMLERAEMELARAERAVPSLAADGLAPLRERLDELVAHARKTCDAEERRSITEETRMIRQGIAALCSKPAIRQQILRRRLDEGVRWYDKDVRRGATAEENNVLDNLYPFRSNLTRCDGGGVVFERRH